MKQTRLIIILLIFSLTSYAQSGILKGRIIDSQKQELPGAYVVIKGTTTGTVSNITGEYVINSLKEGHYSLEISYIGFITYSLEVDIKANQTTIADATLVEGVELGEITINSRLFGETKALNNQKNANNITNIISSEQLERFPDANIGDAMKRLAGINVQYDQGEARFGNIRGTSPELNSVTINGERIPSAEAEIRVVQLDLVPSDMIEAVEFTKALTPDMDADAIGGSVNLVTKSASYQQEISGKLGSGWNFITNKPLFKGNIAYGKRFFSDKIGLVLSASAYDHHLGSDNYEAEWDYSDPNNKDASAYPVAFENRQYYVERFRTSYSAAFDFKINNNHTLFAKGIYNHRNDWENRYRVEYTDIEDNGDGTYSTKIRRQLKFGSEDNKYSRLEDQRMYNFSLGGDHLFNKLKIDWSASYSKANEERPNERYLRYAVKDVVALIDLTDKSTPSISFPQNSQLYTDITPEYSFDELTEEYQYTQEIDKNGRINFEWNLWQGEYASVLKFGARYRSKSKSRDNWLYEYEPTDEDAFNTLVFSHLTNVSKDNFMAGDYSLGKFIDSKISDYINLSNTNDFDSQEDISANAGDFDATETIYAGYAMLTQKIGKKLTVIAGLRAEQTVLEYQGRIYDVPSAEEEDNGAEPTITNSDLFEDNYINFLPAVHIKFSPDNYSNLRVAFTNTLSRPNYYDLVPYQEIDRDDNVILFGNSSLLPTTSMNFDLMYEKFFKNIGIISTGVFYKSLKNVVSWQYKSDYTYQGNTYDEYRKPENIGDATLIGFEAAFNRRLDFLPGIFKNLSFYANYTFVESELKNVIFEGREDEKLPLAGSPKHTYNISLAYDAKKIDVRLSFNHASAFLNMNGDGGFGEEAFFDYFYDKVNYLDLNLNYKINPNFTIYFDANNLLNQPLRTFAGISERTVQSEYYGIKLNLGLKFNF